jgi:NADH dehydrogenase [ubiquinone] 1 alpha subcomplex assembly factor 1
MKNIFTISLAFLVFSLNLKSQPTMESKVIINFNETSSITNWKIVDDVVMGGRSSSDFALNSDGFGLFKGEVSLENNGGFSSLRCDLNRIAVGNYTKIQIRLKGDGKKYQLRIKSDKQ